MGDTYTQDEVDFLSLMRNLSKSYEYYSACNTPQEEWDEYDYMMFPIWLRLRDLLEKHPA